MTWPSGSMKKPHCSNRFVLSVCFYFTFRWRRDAGHVHICQQSANKGKWHQHLLGHFPQGWQKSKSISHPKSISFPLPLPGKSSLNVISVYSAAWLLPLPLSPAFFFSLSPTSHHMLQPHLSICRYRSGSSSLLPHRICLCGSSCLEPGYFLLILQDSLSIYPN